MKVTLKSNTIAPINTIDGAAANCYDTDITAENYKEGRLMRQCANSGHLAVLEFADFVFHIEGVSRALLAQITRHRLASFAVRSQRYCSSFGEGILPLPSGNGQKADKKCHYDVNQEQFLSKMYDKGYSTPELAELYHIPVTTIDGIIKRYTKMRDFSESKFINNNYFAHIDNSLKAYILGFIYADGCISVKPNGQKELVIDQKERERVLMTHILRELKPLGKLIRCGHEDMIRMSVQSNQICDDLMLYGVIPHKGTLADFSMILRNVDDKYIPDVIRGIVDGDGHISIMYNKDNTIADARLEIGGTHQTCEGIQQYLCKKLSLNQTVIQHNGNQSYKLTYGGTRQVKKILNYLYQNVDFNFIHSIKAKALFQLLPEYKQLYCTKITDYIFNTYECVVPPSYFSNIDIINSYINTLDVIRETYTYIQKQLAKNGRYGEAANEDARFILPNACCTILEVKMNLRELMHFMNERLCNRAQWEIRELALEMKKCVTAQYPELADYLVPKCEKNKALMYCPEHKCCGRHPKLKDIVEKIERIEKK